MLERINDILKLANGRIEKHSISKKDYEIIKNDVHFVMQDDIVLSFGKEVDFSKPFMCVEFSEGYVIFYHYNP
ncbi:MAG: hypothetical protein J6A04_04375 [Clostridia bacterium]|nr:hypothetical protein [Clostridia bacterium]